VVMRLDLCAFEQDYQEGGFSDRHVQAKRGQAYQPTIETLLGGAWAPPRSALGFSGRANLYASSRVIRRGGRFPHWPTWLRPCGEPCGACPRWACQRAQHVEGEADETLTRAEI
jgi:hypothetical protein